MTTRVRELRYKFQHDDSVKFEGSPLVETDTGQFKLSLSGNCLTVTMKGDVTTVSEARQSVEPFLRVWEISAYFRGGFGAPNFTFDEADVDEIQDSESISMVAEPGQYRVTGQEAHFSVTRKNYPEPPVNLEWTSDVELLFSRFQHYKTGKTLLPDTAYFCLTVLTGRGSRRDAADRYQVELAVLDKLGELSSTAGGRGARKAKGVERAYSEREIQWLEQALIKLIIRVAEAARPGASPVLLRMADLVRLE